MRLQIKKCILGLALVALIALPTSVFADICGTYGDGGTNTLYYNWSGAPTIGLSLTGCATSTLTVSVTSLSGGFTDADIKLFAWESGGTNQEDGFGKFVYEFTNNASGYQDTITITLASGNWLGFDEFASHIAFNSPTGTGCSGFVANIPNKDSDPGPLSECTTSTPEPGGLALLGAGLCGLLGLVRRKIRT